MGAASFWSESQLIKFETVPKKQGERAQQNKKIDLDSNDFFIGAQLEMESNRSMICKIINAMKYEIPYSFTSQV